MAIVGVENVTKYYRENRAVNDVSLEIKEGEILGLLGPNGAGKSTLISLILEVLKPDRGDILYKGESLIGENNKTYKMNVGFVPQDLAFFPELTAKDNVIYWGRLYGIRGAELELAVKKALEFTGLLDRMNDAAFKFSGGMKRRLNIACGIVEAAEKVLDIAISN